MSAAHAARRLRKGLSALLLVLAASQAWAQLAVTVTATPQVGPAPLSVALAATIIGCLPLMQPPAMVQLPDRSTQVTTLISNPNNTPLSLWRLVLTTSTPNKLVATSALPSGAALARVPNAVVPPYNSNTSNSVLYFDSDGAPTTLPATNPLVIPANGSLSLTFRYDSPLSQGNKNIAIQLYDTGNRLAGTTNVNYESSWDFGDGATDPLYSTTVTHLYTTPGTYTARFSLTCGGTTSGAVTITVNHPAGSFDAVEVGAARGSAIRTKVAGSPFGLDVLTLTADRSGAAPLSGAVKVELVDASAGGALDAHGCNATWPVIQRLPDLVFANQNRRTAANIVVADAWRNARVRMAFPASGAETAHACSSDAFAIRPAAFSAPVATDADWVSPGLARSLGNTAANGGPVHKAGRPFTLQTRALNAAGVLTGNYAGSPAAVVAACAASGCGAVLGTLNVGASAAGGVLLSHAASYGEAGAFALQFLDQSFAAIDAADSTPAERHFSSPVADIGRFVPDRFELTAAAVPQLRTFNDSACAARSFTYVGQPFGYATAPQATVTARNAMGQLTAAYRGALWKLAPASVTQTYAPLAPLVPGLDVAGIGSPALASNENGTGSYTGGAGDLLVFVRSPSAPLPEFTAAITLTLSVMDGSEAAFAGNGSIAAAPLVFDGGGSGIAFDAGSLFRYGRLRLANAYGSELLDLRIPLEAQYWNGYGFVANTADQCTGIAAANVKLSAYVAAGFAANLPHAHVAVGGRFVAGRGNLRLVKPAPSSRGAVGLCVDLDAGAGGDLTCQAASPAGMPWLQDRVSGPAYAQDPAARAAFGLFRAGGSLIYRRENF